MNYPISKEQYIADLMGICVERKIHPSQLLYMVRKTMRRYKGDLTPTGALLETQRRLQETYPGGWM